MTHGTPDDAFQRHAPATATETVKLPPAAGALMGGVTVAGQVFNPAVCVTL